jgi:hypothetical protein
MVMPGVALVMVTQKFVAIEPAAPRRELKVLDEGVGLAAVERSRRRRGEVMIRQAQHAVLGQLGIDDEVRVARGDVQPVEGEHIRARQQESQA